jgi:hypothetical protein
MRRHDAKNMLLLASGRLAPLNAVKMFKRAHLDIQRDDPTWNLPLDVPNYLTEKPLPDSGPEILPMTITPPILSEKLKKNRKRDEAKKRSKKAKYEAKLAAAAAASTDQPIANRLSIIDEPEMMMAMVVETAIETRRSGQEVDQLF